MQIAVLGLWHLGIVTAACLAEAGHNVTGIDDNVSRIASLNSGEMPIQEPGLREMVEKHLATRRLKFCSQMSNVAGHEVVWIAFDTPVDEHDVADTEYVMDRAVAALSIMPANSWMIVSSQLPVGSTARLERAAREIGEHCTVRFAYSPENLRLGNALEVFLKPDRVVVGVRSADDQERLRPIWNGITNRIEWMSIESAEMTKHAINAFLATSVTFTNEVARICERVGADAREVERGLRTDVRIGPRAYVRAGGAFSGGTLARDVVFLKQLAAETDIDAALLEGVLRSNELHRNWARLRLQQCLGSLKGKNISMLGLTYKPGTSTLRRSDAIELSRWLIGEGASVKAFDPAVRNPSEETPELLRISDTVEDVLRGADALIVATSWPEFSELTADTLASAMKTAVVIDPSAFLERNLAKDARIRYYSVGTVR